MYSLNKAEKDYLIGLLQKDEAFPEDFKYKLFPTEHKEYELTYAGKMRKEDILANEDGSFPVPLQIEKVFNENEHSQFDDGWRNLIVLGDNLQFLKSIYENKDPVIVDRVKGKVKLIYIDPPFATTDEFQSKDGAKAYNDKKKGAEFVEYLRKRLIVAYQILADNGSVFVHLDWKMAHYIKIVLDEIFGKNNFRNEIVWAYNGPGSPGMKQFNRKHDTILWYTKSASWIFNDGDIRVEHDIKTIGNFKKGLEGSGFLGDEYDLHTKGKIPEDWWTIAVASRIKIDGVNRTGYPTEKPYKLVERIIRACSNEQDIVMDFFGGSGLVASVAERLNRRWITCDIGKLSYFTTQKRMIQIENAKSMMDHKKIYGKKSQTFVAATLGTYDLKTALELEWEKYKTFVAGLFDIELKQHKIGGYQFDGKKDDYPVIIFNSAEFKDSNVDEIFIADIGSRVSERISGGRVYIVSPSTRVDFLTDCETFDGVHYYFLKIPYQMIKELHQKPFQKFRQPRSKNNINSLDEAIGFSFIRNPSVQSAIGVSSDLVTLKISNFSSNELTSSKAPEEKTLEKYELLSAVFIDKNYNGRDFIMTDYFFLEDITTDENGLVISLNSRECGNKIMVVYTDIYGNDFTESFDISEGKHE